MFRTIRSAACLLVLAIGVIPAWADPQTLPSGNYLMVSVLNRPLVRVLSPANLAQVDVVHTGFRPAKMTAFGSNGRAFVFPEFTTRDEFSDANIGTGHIVGRTHVHWPFNGQLNGDASKLYVSTLEGGEVVAVDSTSGDVIGNLDATPTPGSMDFDATADELYVADNSSGSLSVYDGASDALLRRFNAPTIQELAVASHRVYWTTGGNGVIVSDSTTFQQLSIVPLSSLATRLRPSADRTRVFGIGINSEVTQSTFFVLDTSTNSIVFSLEFPGRAFDFVVEEATNRAFVSMTDDQTIGVVDLAAHSFSTVAFNGNPFYLELVTVP
jgi:DNA-binding beta-propeller fold protein YncE